MLAALDQLPAEQRAALVLVDMEGYPVAEVAEMLDCAVGTVKSRCSRGRARLATLLGVLRPGGDPDHATAGEPRPAPVRPNHGGVPRPARSWLIPSQPHTPETPRGGVPPMSDQHDAGSLPELTPEQESAVRRLLAEARHDEPIPTDVARPARHGARRPDP